MNFLLYYRVWMKRNTHNNRKIAKEKLPEKIKKGKIQIENLAHIKPTTT